MQRRGIAWIEFGIPQKSFRNITNIRKSGETT
jgi:hypothetical protein